MASTLAKFKMDLCCDSVEWCPHKEFDSLFAVGHYELMNIDQTKIGGITLFEYVESNENSSNAKTVNKVLFGETAPILDLKWHSFNANEEKESNESSIYLSAATCNGCIECYSLSKNQNKFALNQKCKLKIKPLENGKNDIICLSLDWNIKNHLCVTSVSDGSICVLQMTKDKLSVISRMNIHSDQAWIASFDSINDKIVYSGADDALFAISDFRNNKIIHKDAETHKMGICAITDSIKHPNLLLTGSYDEYLRMWDKRKLSEPMDSLRYDDGVWRLKWCKNDDSDKILIATMRDHFNIATFDEKTQKLQKLGCYTQHYDEFHKDKKNDDTDILCYGCDWSTNDIVASCSFYDKQVHVWQLS